MPETPEERLVNQVVERLRNRREALGMSINQTAHAAGLDHRAIGRIEAGERKPSLLTLLKLARALDVRLWSVLKEVE